MDRKKQLQVFRAQTLNVRELDRAWTHLQRTINGHLIKGNDVSVQLHTRLLALVFCAWSEATFSKLIHTPHGFEIDEIKQIKAASSVSVGEGWKKCLSLGLRRIQNPPRSNYIPNIRQSVSRIIDSYVLEPSLIRNKIAHGQWCTALNRDNTAVNAEMTELVANVDVVTLMRWKMAYSSLSQMIEELIESPNRAFHRDYWVLTEEMSSSLQRTEHWTLQEKAKQLKLKASRKSWTTSRVQWGATGYSQV